LFVHQIEIPNFKPFYSGISGGGQDQVRVGPVQFQPAVDFLDAEQALESDQQRG